jgi:DNA helicase-2/ATP-dependent DNA helicase PcrA
VATKIIPNPKQRQAIEHPHGPMLVLAGAGTGKTTVLVERIAWLIEQGHARPDEILAITFTENAAAELKARVERRLGRRAAIWAGTFHAYCFAILKRNKRDFFVLTPEDVYVFLRQRIEHLGLRRFIKASDLGQFLDDLRNFFDRCHEELVNPEQFQAYVDSLRPDLSLPRNCKSKDVEELGPEEILARWREIGQVYSNAVRLLEDENLGTFGMMISRAVGLLQSNPELLAQEQQRARFILVDEFQDCNSSNITLAELLGGADQNIFAVGDPDQAIYRFRGASSAAFEEFQRRFPRTQGVTLGENQRSRGNILRVAYAAIEPNPHVRSLGESVNFSRVPLESGRDRRDTEQGRFVFDDPVEAVIGLGDEQEAGDIAEAILRVRENARPREPLSLAVLYRSHFHREKIIEALAARGIPFLVRGMNVTETPVVRDVLAVARAVSNESDADSLFRICALPQFEVAPEELRARLAAASTLARAKPAQPGDPAGGRDKTFRDVLENMEAGKRVLAAVSEAREFVSRQKLAASGALAYLVRQFTLPAGDPAIQALMRFTSDWEGKPFIPEKSLEAFLGYLDLFQDGGGAVLLHSEDEQIRAEEENPDAVRLMTVHAAKGLEFSHVWILRVLAPGFPVHFREPLFEFPAALRSSVALGEGKDIHEQEERRLFYVAITRARDRLVIHSRRGRGKDPTPPGFLRPMLQSRRLAASLQERAGASNLNVPDAAAEISPAGEWMLLPPAFPATGVALSAHAVESYAACPLKFKLEKDWKVPGEAAAAMQYGAAIHTVLRQYYDPSPGAAQLSAEDVVKLFLEEFSKAVIDDPVQRSLYEKMGGEQLRTLLCAQPRGSVDVVAAEVSFSFNLGEQKVVGRIDRLDRIAGNAVRVIDYKTGAVKTKRHAEESLQLSIYAMGAVALGFDPRELAFLNLQGNEPQPTTRSGTQLQKARQRIEDAARGIAAQHFEARPGQHCQWCAYRRLCPATEQRVFLPARPLVEPAIKAAGVTG